MTRYFIVTIDSLVDTFSTIKAGTNIYVEFKINNNIFDTMKKGDKIFGIYNNCVKYIFIVQEVIEKNKIILKKQLEIDNDIRIDEIYQNYEIKEIKKEEFNKIYNEILLNLSIDFSYLYELENKEFAQEILNIIEDNDLLNNDNVTILCDKDKCHNLFKNNFSILKEIDNSKDLNLQTIDKNGKQRYYNDIKKIYNNKDYVITNNWYYGGKKDNRTLFINWLINQIVLKNKNKNKNIIFNKNDKNVDNNIVNEVGYNQIVYGIPGCGKSYYVEHKILEEKHIDKRNDVFRTTFYLDYSNSDFVGQLFPVVDGDNITYKAIPGPFTKALKRAYENKNRMIYLIIEEINRGNAAAIFGDLFQLLDRLKKSKDDRYKGDSEYPITNEFIEGYFKEEKVDFIPGNIYIPRNLTIIATMNTSDQNVFPLDTAFKRRWKMKRITNTWKDHPFADEYIPFTNITWKTFVETINLQIINSSEDGLLLEDKQLGEFFADEEMFVKEKADECIVDDEKKEKLESFTNKVIEYLYNDVFKFNKDKLFENKKSFNEIWETINSYDDDTFKGSKKLCIKVDFNTTEVSSKNTNHTNNGEEISGE